MSKRLIGYGYTNVNGVATLDYDAEGNELQSSGYVGQGVGNVDISASAVIDGSTFVSVPCSVWDTIRYDDGTGTIWSPNANSKVTMEDNGALFENTDNYGGVFIGSNQQIHPIDSAMEFDIVSETGTWEFSVYNSNQTNKGIFNFGNQTNRGVGHWRVEFHNTEIKSYFEGTEISTSPYNVTFGNAPFRVGFIAGTGTQSIKVANFKEYYI